MKKYVVLIAVIIVIGIAATVAVYCNVSVYTATVTDKTRVVKQEESYYLIFTTLDTGEVKVFKNVDSLFKGKFNSSDVYAQIEVGGTYIVKAYGYRVPFLSMYENITKVHRIN